jgi:thioredoxin reductase (NADPH)
VTARASELDQGPTLLHETPDLHGAFPRLDGAQIAALAAHGEERPTQAGEVLIHEGDSDPPFIVILDGLVAVVEGQGCEDETVVGVHGPGRFIGELSQLTGQAAFLATKALEPGRVLTVPVDEVRVLVGTDQGLGDLILRASLLRRSLLLDAGVGFKLMGSRFSPDTRRLREFAARNRLPHHWIDLEDDAHAEALLRGLGVAPEETPVVIWRGVQLLRNPTNDELARLIGLPVFRPSEQMADLVIVGAGPAGLAAAVYGASEGLATIVVDSVATGGQAGTSSRIENYLGFPSGISGGELAERAVIQADKFGARFSVPSEAAGLEEGDGCHVIRMADGSSIEARSVLITSGARYRKLDVPRLEDFEATSVYYAATRVEARVCVDDPVVIVGGGNSAGQATVFLAPRVAALRLVVRAGDLGASMSRYLADRIERMPQVQVLLHTEVRELVGDHALEAVVVENNQTGEREQLPARDLFVFIGAEPNAAWLGDQLDVDDHGFLLTGSSTPASLPLETSRPGVFAAGDVRSGSVKRISSAIGEGAMAVQLVHRYLTRPRV